MSDPVMVGCLAAALCFPCVVAYVSYVVVEDGVPGDVRPKIVMPFVWLISVGVMFGFAAAGDDRYNSGSADNLYPFYWVGAIIVAVVSFIVVAKELRDA